MVDVGLQVFLCFHEAGTAYLCFKLSKLGLILFNVFSLVNTWHALGFSVFLMVDTLTSIRCHLRATESRLNFLFSTAET